MPEILDRDLPRPDDVCLCWLSFLLTAMMAAGQEEDREEEKDAAPHSLFCERISAETGTRDKRRQRRDRRQRRERKSHAAQRLLPIPFTSGFPPTEAPFNLQVALTLARRTES